MAKVLVLYYSSCGHIETMAYALSGSATSARCLHCGGPRFESLSSATDQA